MALFLPIFNSIASKYPMSDFIKCQKPWNYSLSGRNYGKRPGHRFLWNLDQHKAGRSGSGQKRTPHHTLSSMGEGQGWREPIARVDGSGLGSAGNREFLLHGEEWWKNQRPVVYAYAFWFWRCRLLRHGQTITKVATEFQWIRLPLCTNSQKMPFFLWGRER